MFADYMPQVSNIGERRQLIKKNKCEGNEKRRTTTEILTVGSLQPIGYIKTFINCAVKMSRWQEKMLPYFRSNIIFAWKLSFFSYRPRITQQSIIIL